MSMLKSKVAKAVAATIALATCGSAFATADPYLAPTDLLVAVWNPTTATSYVQDLGAGWTAADLNGATFNSASGASFSQTLDGGHLATDLGGSSNLSFALFAVDLSPGQADFTNVGNSVFLSNSVGVQPEDGNSIFNSAGPNLSTYVNQIMGNADSFLTGDDQSAGSKYWAAKSNVNAPGSNFTINGYTGGTSGSGTLTLLKFLGFTDDGNELIQPTVIGNSQHAGVFALDDATGVLSYSLAAVSGPATPLPAAGWLLVSGLFGLGAVGRRKNAAS